MTNSGGPRLKDAGGRVILCAVSAIERRLRYHADYACRTSARSLTLSTLLSRLTGFVVAACAWWRVAVLFVVQAGYHRERRQPTQVQVSAAFFPVPGD